MIVFWLEITCIAQYRILYYINILGIRAIKNVVAQKNQIYHEDEIK